MLYLIKQLYRIARYRTVDDIAKHAYSSLCTEYREMLAAVPMRYDMIRHHHDLGRWIRNEYGLWNPYHPLTRPHFTASPPAHADDVCYHPSHPDEVSMRILHKMWDIAHNR